MGGGGWQHGVGLGRNNDLETAVRPLPQPARMVKEEKATSFQGQRKDQEREDFAEQ